MSQGIMSDIDFAEQVLLVRQGLAWWQRPVPPPAPRLPPVTCDPLPLSLLLSQNFQEMFGGLARAFERRYQVFRRRGHYWLEKRERELWRTYLDRLAEFSNTHDLGERAEEIDAWFRKERKDIDREKRRLEDEATRRFCARDKARCARLRVRRERAAARRAKLRESRWTRWAAACADAVRRGLEPPPAPGARRRSGAPVRRLCRSSVNPAPSPSALAAAFDAARGRGRVEEKIRCGSLLLDLEATVDSSLVRTAAGEIAGRRPGLRGWIGDHLPYLLNHYASLMQYRRLAQAFREAHGLRDPHPATILLDDDAPAVFPQPLRARFEAARKEAKEFLATGAGRTMKDLRAALSRREWRRTG